MCIRDSPSPSRRDSHLLVVVADRATGRKRVAEPMPVFFTDSVRMVRKCGCALVCRDNEVGVIAVMSDDVFRRHQFVGHQILGEVEQTTKKGPVGLDAFVQIGSALRLRRWILHKEYLL